MEDDDLYGDLYGEEPAQPQVAVDPRKRAPPPAPVQQPQSSSSFTPLTGSFRAVPPGQSNYIPAAYAAQAAAAAQQQQQRGNQSYPSAPPAQSGSRSINSYHDAAEHRAPQRMPASHDYEDGKMFIGGLSWETTEDTLMQYFGQYGNITSASVMRDPSNGRSRGFAFLSFKDPSSVNVVMAHTHFVDGKQVDPKRAVPPPNKKAMLEEPRTEKLFVRSIAPEITQQMFQAYWGKFGAFISATLMTDKETGQNRGYGFVDFESADSVDAVLDSMPHYINGTLIDTKKSHPKPRRDGLPGAPGLSPEQFQQLQQQAAQQQQIQQQQQQSQSYGQQSYAQQAPLAAAVSAPPQPTSTMTGNFNAQTVADYFRKITGGDASRLANFDPQKMFAEIAASAPAPAPVSRPTYAEPPTRPQGLQSIGTFMSDEPPVLRKSIAQHAGFDDGYDVRQYGAPPADAPRGPRGGDRFHPYAR